MKDTKKILQYFITSQGVCVDRKISCLDCPIYEYVKKQDSLKEICYPESTLKIAIQKIKTLEESNIN